MSIEIIEDSGPKPSGANVLTASDAERLVENLRSFSVHDVGSAAWIRQHGVIEKLNLQAHHNASANSDPFVLEALITFDKLKTIVNELVVVEAWREFAFPKMHDSIDQRNSMRVYFVLYHEAVLLNLLEVLMYHQHAAEALEDEMVDLVDVCARKMTLLNARSTSVQPRWFANAKERFDWESTASTAEQLAQHRAMLGFRACVSGVTVARYIGEHIKHLSVSVMARVLDTHDFMVHFVALLENPPWVRRTEEGKWEKFYDQEWHQVPPRDLLLVTRNEGQVWIGLYNLMCESECQKRYHFNSSRKDAVLRVRKYLNEVLVDQLPVLQHVQRYMDQLAIMEPPAPTDTKSFIVQQVPALREAALRGTDWDALAAKQLAELFGSAAEPGNDDLKSLAELYGMDEFEAVAGK
mmetsp:Transcript_20311/g.64900  ORF Transcript_20311/g.64900 Transcript_20311/m.64900 type:complete len:409 (+) Transcript_20311:599-1825(+)